MFKKIIIFCASFSSLFFYITKIFAGGLEIVPIIPQFSGIYLQANIAYAYRPWRSDSIINPFSAFGGKTRGGFSTIDGLGYQFNEFTALELAYIYLPHPKGEFASGLVFSVRSWASYIAGKLIAPVYLNTYVFGKAGLAYISSSSSLPLGLPGNLHSTSNFCVPMFAFGAEYYYSPNVSVNLQYMHLPGYHGFNQFISPAADIFSFGIAYKFLI